MLDHWLEQEIAQGVQHDDTLHHERPLYHCEYPRSNVYFTTSPWQFVWNTCWVFWKEMFYLTTHSTHFIYGYMASDIWLRTILIVREETRCRHIGYSFRLTARVVLYAPFHRQDSTYHGLCYTSRGALAGTRNSSVGSPMKDRSDDPSHHERTLLPRSYISLHWCFGVN